MHCPYCGMEIPFDAIKCPYCQSDLRAHQQKINETNPLAAIGLLMMIAGAFWAFISWCASADFSGYIGPIILEVVGFLLIKIFK